MAKAKKIFSCQNCGATYPRWAGKCDACDEWNTLTEEIQEATLPKGIGARKGNVIDFMPLDGEIKNYERHKTEIEEFDRVTGGGLVPGSVLLVGGDPGIGKSTLLLQVVARLAKNNKCFYISGEESAEQVQLRAQRLGLAKAQVRLASATSVRDIVSSLEAEKEPTIAIIDSIQTVFIDTIQSAPGTVSQVRTSAQELIRIAKKRGIILVLVGHVTKEGQIAGPRVLEHMVDTVLYFEGDRGHQFRILRSVKNRFGAANEIGVFEMTQQGLMEVQNPSEIFLADRQGHVSGAAVFAGLEGSRPVLVEIQALVAPSALATPRRAVVGWDSSRLAMVLAVLEARCGVKISQYDIYLNVAGGLKISEPAADLAVAAALISSLTGEAVPDDMVIFGEIGLSGEVRAVGQTENRLKESAKLGFEKALSPKARKKQSEKTKTKSPIKEIQVGHLTDILPLFGNPEDIIKSQNQD